MYYYEGHRDRVSNDKASGGMTGEASLTETLDMLESEGCKSITIDISLLRKHLSN